MCDFVVGDGFLEDHHDGGESERELWPETGRYTCEGRCGGEELPPQLPCGRRGRRWQRGWSRGGKKQRRRRTG